MNAVNDLTPKIMAMLEPFELSECNGNYQQLVAQRMQGMADIHGIAVTELTLDQAVQCIEKASTEWEHLSQECRALERRIRANLPKPKNNP
jgi:hypothetical protein